MALSVISALHEGMTRYITYSIVLTWTYVNVLNTSCNFQQLLPSSFGHFIHIWQSSLNFNDQRWGAEYVRYATSRRIEDVTHANSKQQVLVVTIKMQKFINI